MPESKRYIVLLRGVNVSGKNIIKMALLKNALLKQGFENVETYIQSGNIILESFLSQDIVSSTIKSLIQKDFSLEIVVFVRTLSFLKKALEINPFDSNLEPNKVFITFLSAVPDPALVLVLQDMDLGNEIFSIKNDLLFYYLPDGMAKSKMNNNFFEKKLKINGTGRNVNTIQKLIDLINK